MVPLFINLNRETANTYHLVLSAAGIGSRIRSANNRYYIDVPEPFVDSARDAVNRYLAENPTPVAPVDPPDDAAPPVPVNISGVAVALFLLAVHMAVVTSAAPQDYVTVFGASARMILSGEWYRCATALLLHADAAHLAGNMAGMALFGGAVCAIMGTGVGWLLILACGIMGNLINAIAYGSGHLSVGASTSVFGAIGLLCAIRAITAMRTGKGWRPVAVLLGSSVALLAFLGAGERSDLGAHLFGVLAGLVAGSIHALVLGHQSGLRLQVASGILAATTLMLAWFRGAIG
ncbi:rhomboid family intramembrane serine protease [Desulfosarcina ovata subsp. sediminis]|uniref:Rhomboid family intramembrane serine protease n=1 Tax=Desulfosarcina ovata subsp. sediminis TaxID=885957 RepID=A0A5K7ZYE2_9BACT|nr:rhomboid family intramembrane serine protease [Desulfosarcina ovata]BBO85293.1 rhomboid family intramembrane serine protease [Desulfosarcina ovata subsp. sediminis]